MTTYPAARPKEAPPRFEGNKIDFEDFEDFEDSENFEDFEDSEDSAVLQPLVVVQEALVRKECSRSYFDAGVI